MNSSVSLCPNFSSYQHPQHICIEFHHIGTWIKRTLKAVEVALRWTKSIWKGNKDLQLTIFSFLLILLLFNLIYVGTWQNGLLMANDIACVDLEEACQCIGLSKNDILWWKNFIWSIPPQVPWDTYSLIKKTNKDKFKYQFPWLQIEMNFF